jgi:hypothetical protein
MTKSNEIEQNVSEEETNEIDTAQIEYEALGFVGLGDDIQGEKLLKKLNILTGITYTGYESFFISPEWMMQYQDWNKKSTPCLTHADKARAEASFDEVEFIFDPKFIPEQLGSGHTKH